MMKKKRMVEKDVMFVFPYRGKSEKEHRKMGREKNMSIPVSLRRDKSISIPFWFIHVYSQTKISENRKDRLEETASRMISLQAESDQTTHLL